MTQIGSFTRTSDGSFTGSIKTLAFNVQARLIPSDPATASEKAPDLRVVVSGVEIGAGAGDVEPVCVVAAHVVVDELRLEPRRAGPPVAGAVVDQVAGDDLAHAV